jgi:hypothetical protein
MSKDIEVGDVFEYHNTRYIITEINNMGYIYIFRPKAQPEFISQTFANDGKAFLKMQYLGKSEVNISDLFKTENE